MDRLRLIAIPMGVSELMLLNPAMKKRIDTRCIDAALGVSASSRSLDYRQQMEWA